MNSHQTDDEGRPLFPALQYIWSQGILWGMYAVDDKTAFLKQVNFPEPGTTWGTEVKPAYYSETQNTCPVALSETAHSVK